MQLSNQQASPLIEMATEGKRRTPWWLSYIVMLVAILVVGPIGSEIPRAVLKYENGSVVGQVFEGVSFALQILAVFLWVRLFEGRGFTSLGLRGTGLGRGVLGFVIGTVLMVVVVGIATVLGAYTVNTSPDHGSLGGAAIAIAIGLILSVVVQASGEEIVVRGFVQQANSLALPGVVALLLPSLLFALLHMVAGFDLIAFVCILLYAVFAVLIALREGSLWLIAGIHIGWNWAQGNLLGAPVSGNAPREATIFTIAPNANASAMLTGGTFGPEATIIAAIVWAACVVAAFLYFRSGSAAGAR